MLKENKSKWSCYRDQIQLSKSKSVNETEDVENEMLWNLNVHIEIIFALRK